MNYLKLVIAITSMLFSFNFTQAQNEQDVKNKLKHETLLVSNQAGETSEILARVLIKGNVSLYKAKGVFYLKIKDEVVPLKREFKESNGIKVPENKYLNTLKRYFYNDKDVLEKIDQTEYTSKSLKAIVKQYNKNQWPDEQLYIGGKKRIKLKKSIGASIGSYTVKDQKLPSLIPSQTSKFGSNFSVGAGLILEYNWKFSNEIGLYFTKRKTEFSHDFSFGSIRYFFDHNYLDIPVLLHYTIFPKKITPRITLGTNFIFPISDKKIPIVQDVTNATGESFLEKSQIELVVGLGLKSKINSTSFSIDYNFKYGFGQIDNQSVIEINTISHNLKLGFAF